MRVNELSKELGKTNKEVLEILKKNNYDVKSHASNITEEQVAARSGRETGTAGAGCTAEGSTGTGSGHAAGGTGTECAAEGPGGPAGTGHAAGTAPEEKNRGGIPPAEQRPASETPERTWHAAETGPGASGTASPGQRPHFAAAAAENAGER